MARSEQAAWLMVRELAHEIQKATRSPARVDVGKVQVACEDLLRECDVMLGQLRDGVHANPKRHNPALIVWPNPGGATRITVDKLLSSRAFALSYKHRDDGLDYEHPFSAGCQVLCAVTDTGQKIVVLTRPDGRELWADF